MTSGEAGVDDFLPSLRRRAAEVHRTIVFPEGTEPRVHEAAARVVGERLVRPVLLGPPAEVAAGLHEVGLEPSSVTVVDPAEAEVVARTLAHLRVRRAGRNDPEDRLDAMARDPLVQAGTMVALGEAHGAVAGSVRTTADVVRAGLVTIGLAPGLATLSSAFYMVFEPDHPTGPAVLTFTDAGVVPHPDPAQLADIARAAAAARPLVVGDAPRLAFLSYSTLGSADGPSIAGVREALDLFRRAEPSIPADGELQGDAALSERVARRKAPGSPVAGAANVLVFPDLDAANIAYKLVQHLGGAVALGPILQGLNRPFNDLSRGATAPDIAQVACITALMAG